MTMLTTIAEQKTHIIYVVILALVVGIAYHMLQAKPREIIKTVTETKFATQEVVKTKNVYVDRVTTTKKANGDVITVVDNSRSVSGSDSKLVSKDTVSRTEVIRFMSTYSIDVMYPVSLNPTFNPLDFRVVGGVRIFNLPIFATVGTTVRLNQITIGVRAEF